VVWGQVLNIGRRQ